MNKNFRMELDQLQEDVNNKKLEQAKLQERLKTLEEDKIKYETQLKELGIDNIEDLKKEIETLSEQIEAGFSKAKGQME